VRPGASITLGALQSNRDLTGAGAKSPGCGFDPWDVRQALGFSIVLTRLSRPWGPVYSTNEPGKVCRERSLAWLSPDSSPRTWIQRGR